jgi:hypothetical protein
MSFVCSGCKQTLPDEEGCYASVCHDCGGCSFVFSDEDRIDWLEAHSDRLEDVRGRVNNEGGSVRDAIDWFMKEAKSAEWKLTRASHGKVQ